MTTELNKRICEEMGICWHENVFEWENCDKPHHGNCPNPNFCTNAAVLLDTLKDEIYAVDFMDSICDYDGKYDDYCVPLKYILNPVALCEKFLEWRKK